MNQKIVLLENIHTEAVKNFTNAWYENLERYETAFEWQELMEKLQEAEIIGVRSRCQITKELLESCPKLRAIWCFSIGTNNVDLECARNKWIPVFNAPYASTRSVTEITIWAIIMLLRRVFEKSNGAHDWKWMKDNINCFEVKGKTLWIIGYGNIGSQVWLLAEALGMKVVYHDVENKLSLGLAQSLPSLDSLLEQSDVVSVHVPWLSSTKNLIDEIVFKKMKKWSYFINASRWDVTDTKALADAIATGKILWAYLDVFPTEPKWRNEAFESELRGLSNVILTPHIGGSTAESQAAIALDVSGKLMNYLQYGNTKTATNFPQLWLKTIKENCKRILFIHENRAWMMAKLNTIFWEHHIQIYSQHLDTFENIGYAALDVEKATPEILSEISQLPGNIYTYSL